MEYPKRKRTRLQHFDYSHRYAYFITICTQDRRPILSEISRGGALLRPAGKIVEAQILGLPDRFDILVDKFVIMPNHIHLLMGGAREEQSSSPTMISVIQALNRLRRSKSTHWRIAREDKSGNVLSTITSSETNTIT